MTNIHLHFFLPRKTDDGITNLHVENFLKKIALHFSIFVI